MVVSREMSWDWETSFVPSMRSRTSPGLPNWLSTLVDAAEGFRRPLAAFAEVQDRGAHARSLEEGLQARWVALPGALRIVAAAFRDAVAEGEEP